MFRLFNYINVKTVDTNFGRDIIIKWKYKYPDPIYNSNGSTVFYIRAPHHLYLGIAIILMGWLSAPYYSTTAFWCYVIGGLISLDDIIEHTITAKTPLRILFNWLNEHGLRYLR